MAYHQVNHAYQGVVTLADQAFFAGFALLYESIQNSYPVPVSCYDGGLTSEQRTWASEHMPNCQILPIPQSDDVDRVFKQLGGVSDHNTREAMLWLCPFLIEDSPYQKAVWLDSDTIVVENLDVLFKHIDSGPVFTPNNHEAERVRNKPHLYVEMPLRGGARNTQPLINAGVSGWDCVRDRHILLDYMLPAIVACSNKVVRQSITWHDQGSLIWAIQNNELHHRVLGSSKWNWCAIHTNRTDYHTLDDNLNEQLKTAYPGANIVHWNHASLQDKLFSNLGSESDILNWVSLRLNYSGTRHTITNTLFKQAEHALPVRRFDRDA